MLHYQLQGEWEDKSRIPVLLLHGLCENIHVWDKVTPSLLNYPLISIDLPGFGNSSRIAASTMEAMAGEVIQVIDHLKIPKIIVIGHSMGGYVSLAIAEKYMQRLGGFGLFHSTALADNEERKQKRLKQLESIATYGKEPFLKDLHKGLFGKDYKNEKTMQEVWEMLMGTEEAGITNAIRAIMSRRDRTDVLKRSTVPVLIIAGKYDEIIPVNTLATQVALPDTVQFEILSSSGHMGMLEEEVRSGEILTAFYEMCTLYK